MESSETRTSGRGHAGKIKSNSADISRHQAGAVPRCNIAPGKDRTRPLWMLRMGRVRRVRSHLPGSRRTIPAAPDGAADCQAHKPAAIPAVRDPHQRTRAGPAAAIAAHTGAQSFELPGRHRALRIAARIARVHIHGAAGIAQAAPSVPAGEQGEYTDAATAGLAPQRQYRTDEGRAAPGREPDPVSRRQIQARTGLAALPLRRLRARRGNWRTGGVRRPARHANCIAARQLAAAPGAADTGDRAGTPGLGKRSGPRTHAAPGCARGHTVAVRRGRGRGRPSARPGAARRSP